MGDDIDSSLPDEQESSEDDGFEDILFATKAQSSFSFFAQNVVDQSKYGDEGFIMKDFHKEWVDALQNNKRVAITAATGIGKSETVGVLFPLWKAFKDPGWTCLIVAPSKDQSKRLLRRIKEHIEDSEYLKHLKDESENTWSTKEIELTNGSRIFCKPYNQNIKGAHVDFVIADEAAEYHRKGGKEIFHSSVKTRAQRKDGTVALISTPVSENDLMADLSEGYEIGTCPKCGKDLDRLDPKFDNVSKVEYVCEDHGEVEDRDYNENISAKGYWNGTYPAISEDEDEVYFPEAFDMDKLMRLKREDRASFVREYKCKAVSVEGDVFDANDIISCYDEEYDFHQSPKDSCDYYLGADFAVSKQGDYSVFVVVEHTEEGEKRICYMERMRGISLTEQERRIKELHRIYNFTNIVIDSSNFGETVFQNLRDEGMPVEGQSFQVKARNNLIINLKTTFEDHGVTIPRGLGNGFDRTRTLTDKLYEELLGFGTTETDGGMITYKSSAAHDDTVMALGMALNAVKDNREMHSTIAFA